MVFRNFGSAAIAFPPGYVFPDGSKIDSTNTRRWPDGTTWVDPNWAPGGKNYVAYTGNDITPVSAAPMSWGPWLLIGAAIFVFLRGKS